MKMGIQILGLELLCGMCENRMTRGLSLLLILLIIRLHHSHLIYSDILYSDVLVYYWRRLLNGFDRLPRATIAAMVLEAILAPGCS